MAGAALTFVPEFTSKEKLDLRPGSGRVKIDEILPRRSDDTRAIDAANVVDLAVSMAALGLVEPLVIDTKGHLIAGAHRLAALHLVSIIEDDQRRAYFLSRLRCPGRKDLPKRADALADRVARIVRTKHCPYEHAAVLAVEIPSDDKRRAFAIELAENTTRKQYTPDEIRALADRLKKDGYKHDAGRPKAGETTVLGILESAVGRSKRQIDRILNDPQKEKPAPADAAWLSLVRAAKRVVEELQHSKGKEASKRRRLAQRIVTEATSA